MNIARLSGSWLIKGRKDQSIILEQLALQVGFRFSEICNALDSTPRHLHQIFVRDVGLSPKAWLKAQRMVAARYLLQAGTNPAEVAITLGFATPSNFGREFKATYEVTPGQYFRNFLNQQPTR